MPTLGQALEKYLDTNGFSTASYTAPTVEIPIGPVAVTLPNSPGRKVVVRWHDLHHVATGYGTSLTGEAEIGAFELRAGCTNLAAYVYNGMAVAMGLLISPLRTLQAFRDARGATTLYRLELDYDETLALDVSEVRRLMRIPAEGLAKHPVALHSRAPALAQRS